MMALLRNRGKLAPFVASAEVIKVDDAAQAQALYLKRQNWQERVWLYYDAVPEVHYAAQYMANAMGKIRLVAARIDELTDDEQPTEVEDGPVADAVKKLKSRKGGQSALLKNVALNLFGPGETMLLGTQIGKGQDWEALSIDELRVIPGTLAQRYRFPGAVPQDIPKESLIIRVWRSHPRFSAIADSALAACIDQCEQLLLLTKAEKAAARSRFAGSGLLFIPMELVPPAWQNQARYQDPAQSNPLVQQLTEAMMEPLRDESHPSSVVPLMLFGPAEYGEKIKYFTFERALDKQLQAMKADAIKRLAAGIDMPSELVDGGGMGRTNHWSSMQISEAAFEDHIQPFIESVCDALTTGYLVPALVRAGMKQADAENYCVWYDATQLIAKADKSEGAMQVHDRLALSDEALRKYMGFTEADAPSAEEYAKRVGVKLMQPQMAVTGDVPPMPDPNAAPGGAPGGGGPGRPNVRAGQAPSTPGGPGAGPPRQASERRVTGPVSQGPVPGVDKHPQLRPTGAARHLVASAALNEDALGVRLARLDQRMMRQLRSHGEAVVDQALQAAGRRLRGRLRPSVASTYADVPDALLGAALGPAERAEIPVDIGDLMPDDETYAESERRVLQWLASGQEEALAYLRGWLAARAQQEGYTVDHLMPTYEQAGQAAARLWRDNLLQLTTHRMFNPQTTPDHGEDDGVRFPPDLARKVLLRAGGGSISPADAPLAGGVGTGRNMQELMRDLGVPNRGLVWVYGPARRSFQGHLQLDGATFDNVTDPVLHVWPEDSWLARRYYTPGDHHGCQCFIAPNTD